MPRRARVLVPGLPVHIIQRGHNRAPVFFSNDDCSKYLLDLQAAAEKTQCAIHAYVLMTNHVHIVASPATQTSLAQLMKSVGSRYVRFINTKYQRSGTLWESRYKSALIDTEQYLLTCCRYVELNPVRAGMVDHPSNYLWSSYHHNAVGKTNALIKAHETYINLGATKDLRRAAYCAQFESHISGDDFTLITESTNRNSIMGNDRFRKDIEAALGRSLMLHTHGGYREKKSSSKPPSP